MLIAKDTQANCTIAICQVPMDLDDTIVAIATPPGRGGIGVVRLAGPEACSIASAMLGVRRELAPGRALFAELIEPSTGERIDEVVVTFFAKPHSYTTDDVVEISAHGSPVVLRHIVELATCRRRAAGRAGRIHHARLSQWPHRSYAG